jgi:O-antigen/teichoic acid export membrane protein
LAEPIAAFFRFPELVMLLRVHMLALLIQGVQSPAIALLLRNLDMGRRVRLDLIRRLIEATATIALAWWLRSVWALLWGQLIGFAVSVLLSFRIAPFKPRFCLNRDSLGYFAQYGKHFNLITILTFGVMNTGEFVVGRILGAEKLGIYQVALAIPMLVGLRASTMMSQVNVPAFAILRQDPPGAIRAFGFQIGVMSLALIPLATGVALFTSNLVGLFFGQRWMEAAGPLQMLCPYAVFAGLSGVMGSLHYGLGRPDLQTRIWLVQFLVYAAAIVPLTRLFGLMGAAAALTLSFAVGFVHHVAYTLHLLGTEVWAVFSALARVAWPVVALGGVLVLTREVPVGPVAGSALAICGLVGTTAFALYLWRIEYPRLVGLWKGTGEARRRHS